MSTAVSGRAREYRVRNAMTRAGWLPVMRAAASKGVADLLMAHPEHGAALVQVGTVNKAISPDGRAKFTTAATLCGALAICAQVLPGVGIRYWLVGDGPASTWAEWSP